MTWVNSSPLFISPDCNRKHVFPGKMTRRLWRGKSCPEELANVFWTPWISSISSWWRVSQILHHLELLMLWSQRLRSVLQELLLEICRMEMHARTYCTKCELEFLCDTDPCTNRLIYSYAHYSLSATFLQFLISGSHVAGYTMSLCSVVKEARYEFLLAWHDAESKCRTDVWAFGTRHNISLVLTRSSCS